jgi:hypothetical protein
MLVRVAGGAANIRDQEGSHLARARPTLLGDHGSAPSASNRGRSIRRRLRICLYRFAIIRPPQGRQTIPRRHSEHNVVDRAVAWALVRRGQRGGRTSQEAVLAVRWGYD